MKANRQQIINNIATIIRDKDKKIEQLEKVQGITMTCTSDDRIYIICELYCDNIVRYLIEGTRSSMTITANMATNEIIRKPNGIKPWQVAETDCWAFEILKKVR